MFPRVLPLALLLLLLLRLTARMLIVYGKTEQVRVAERGRTSSATRGVSAKEAVIGVERWSKGMRNDKNEEAGNKWTRRVPAANEKDENLPGADRGSEDSAVHPVNWQGSGQPTNSVGPPGATVQTRSGLVKGREQEAK
ncbi:hypothetical protein IWX49DRAFT_635084 [Phyllosticta citricarpa]|uniref:Secreted protein n=1 Tax=Phyllosticta citricarpa TaxID=55181 RepID=A0ABR1MP86_9PEZI